MKHLFIIVTLFITNFCFSQQFPQSSSAAKITYSITNTLNNTYCYDIYSNNQKLISQTSIPALQGNKGFSTKEQAKQVAHLVVTKIKQGQMPPTVTTAELKLLKIIPQ